jgi:uncharacterized membrane protein YfcA
MTNALPLRPALMDPTEQPWLQNGVLAAAAVIGGALNSVAGGGSFFTFPALLLAGIAPVSANATSAVALWPAAVAASFAYRDDLHAMRRTLVSLSGVSALGGLVGAVLLLWTPDATLSRIVPYLLLAATLVFTFGRRMIVEAEGSVTRGVVLRGMFLQFAIAVYGGYFGGGMGIVMIAAFSLMGMTDIHAMNALKSVLGTLINLVAVALFIAAGTIAWKPGLVMIVAATLGGYVGARTARRIDAAKVRRFVLVVAWSTTVFFFWKAWASAAQSGRRAVASVSS